MTLLYPILVALALSAGDAPAERPQAATSKAVEIAPEPEEEVLEPTTSAIQFESPRLPEEPANGQGRLSIQFSDARRWCTFPDDRVRESPRSKRGKRGGNRDVYTFGYQFTVAALRHSQPDRTLLLYESPFIRTAAMHEAVKLGRGGTTSRSGPSTGKQGKLDASRLETSEAPGTLVPRWRPDQRCATLPEEMGFDLEPDVYDVYIAFDLLLRSGTWVHRSIAFVTEVEIEQAQKTKLLGSVALSAGGRREVTLERSPDPPRSEGGANDS